MINAIRRIGLAGAGLALILSATPVHAQFATLDKLLLLTFNGPVQLPGVTLPAGAYRFRIASPDTSRRAWQVLSRDSSRFYGTFLTNPILRDEATDHPVVIFAETPAGTPPAVRAFFYPTEHTGYELIYPKSHRQAIEEPR